MKHTKLILGIALLLPLICQADGLTLGATRLIYEAGKKEASVPLRNGPRQAPQLVQNWVSNFDSRDTNNIPFINTPPLFKLPAGGESPVRVVYVGLPTALPKDRESLFLLNIRTIPAVEKKQNPTRLTIATQNIIKLIYRPEGLTARGAAAAGEKLQISAGSGRVIIKNPTPYVVTLTQVTVNGSKIENPGTLRPLSSLEIALPASALRTFSWSTINDWGGTTPSRTVNF
ncbi:molecular chaperone [Erwinia sp. QL-Z3]|uniref:fimbrial biogenesis chaperone n=1 Tax=Erwinia sp. QL-Z3 TaxID=2547962 RepID=UPI0010714792|nr:molecular chaperone [Erwinia sp. QL-Z3]QBR48857.1 molecular chaperone [Erwinia sp. QL-Z3]